MIPISNIEKTAFGAAVIDNSLCVVSYTERMRQIVGEFLKIGSSLKAFPLSDNDAQRLDRWLTNSTGTFIFSFEELGQTFEFRLARTNDAEFMIIATDVTAQVAQRRRLELLATAVDQAWESVCITDADLESPGPRYVYCNEGFTALTGHSQSEVLGLNPRMMQGPLTDKSVLAKLKENLVNGENFHGSTINYRKDGSPFWLEWKISAVKDASGRITNYIAFQRDVTELRESERKINDMHSVLAHELRAPLTSVNGALGLLQLEVADNDLAKELVEIALLTGKSLVDLIADMLDLRQIEKGKINLKLANTSAFEVIQKAANTMKRYREDVFIENILSETDDVMLVADGNRLSQVLVNLLSNAIKYSPAQGRVRVTCSRQIDKNSARFTVSDQGPGMTAENLKKLFEYFSQVEAADGTTREGSGLGLAISKALVEAHGGCICVESVPGEGTSVWFEVPLSEQRTLNPLPITPTLSRNRL